MSHWNSRDTAGLFMLQPMLKPNILMHDRTLLSSYNSTTTTDSSSIEMNEEDSSLDENVRTIADSTTSSYSLTFCEGEDVLWRSQDGMLYLGVVVEVELDSASCLVRFGDCTEKWSHFGDLRRLGDDEPADPEPEPKVPISNLLPLPAVPKFNGSVLPSDTGSVPDHVSRARKELPYDFDSLLWDENHQRNDKERYCYCGESGDWYKKMLQCNRCLQWFHQDCIRITHSSPLLLGDRFFDFVCTLCTGTCEEVLRRLDLTLTDALHLALFNLTVMNSKKYHNIESSVIPFIRTKWKSLQGPGNILKSSRLEPQYLYDLLCSNKSRFRSGSEIKKRSTFWGLRKIAPPVPPPMGNLRISNGHGICLPDNFYHAKSNKRKRTLPMPIVKPGSVRKTAPAFSQKSSEVFLKSSLRGGSNNSSKRGRPPRFKPRDSLDSCTSSETSSGTWGSLDLFIPLPSNFEGYNNPFRDVDNCLRRIPSESSKNVEDKLLIRTFDVINPPPLWGESPSKKSAGGLFDNFKSSISSIFCPKIRSTKSEKLFNSNICGRRLTLDGEIQYLVECDLPQSQVSPTID